MSDSERKAAEFKPLTREGLEAYFKQGYYNEETGRVDWELDTLITLMLTSDHQAYKAGRASALKELEQEVREAFAAGRVLISKRPYPHPIEYLFETLEEYLRQKTENKEAND